MFNLDNYVTNSKMGKLASKIIKSANAMQGLSDLELKNRYLDIKKIFDPKHRPKVYSFEVFRIVYELVRRKLNICAHLEQLVCAFALSEGYFVEMKTGEGKTISALFAGVLLSMYGRVHIVTVNDYLAGRDYKLAKKVYEILGIDVSVILETREIFDKTVYEASVIYSSNHALAFDFLKDGYFYGDKTVFSSLPIAIVDEVDFVLIDNANSSFSVSMDKTTANGLEGFYRTIKDFAAILKGQEILNEDFQERYDVPGSVDYVFNKAYDQLYLTDLCLCKIENIFGVNWDKEAESNNYYHCLIDTLKARHFLILDEDYIIDNNRIVLVNRTNGRIMPNSRLSQGIHMALELKEGLMVSEWGTKENRISYQTLFSKFQHLCGMSGTLDGVEEELYLIFKCLTLRISENKKNIRIDSPDRFFMSDVDRLAELDRIIQSNAKIRRPILIVCRSDRQASDTFKHIDDMGACLLISRTSDDEDKIIRVAGELGSLLVTTNMASRGTDIVVTESSEEVGGLLVISLGHFDCKRIDDQIRGRAGRQGARGECLFLCSLDDEMWKYETSEELKADSYKLLTDTDTNRNNKYLSARLSKIQLKIQENNQSARKYVHMVDSVLDAQKVFISRMISDIHENVETFVSGYLEKITTTLYEGRFSQRVITLFGIKVAIDEISREECLKLYQSIFTAKICGFTKEISGEVLKSLLCHQMIKVWPAYCEDAEMVSRSVAGGSSFDALANEYTILMGSYFNNFILSVILSQFSLFLGMKRNQRNGGMDLSERNLF